MWPLDSYHFHQRNANKEVQLFNANAYSYSKEVMYPICYIGASTGTWKVIMGQRNISDNVSLHQRIVGQLDKAVTQYGTEEWNKPGYGVQWYYDQKLFGQQIGKWEGYPSKCEMINRPTQRQFLADRLDRGKWKMEGKKDLEGMIDAHLLRPGYLEHNWKQLKLLLQELVTPSQLAWIQTYRDKYLQLYNHK